MKTKEEKSQKTKNKDRNKQNFLKINWVPLVLIFLAILVILALSSILITTYLNKRSIEKEISQNKFTTDFALEKIICYSNATGTNHSENKAMWSLNLSQYTDIAIYLNSQVPIQKIYINQVSFSNPSIGNLSLNYLPIESFGKVTDNTEITSSQEIELPIVTPITLRYLNSNFKTNQLITDIETPLSFDGSLLKRAKITLSSLKNTISFTLNIIDANGESYQYPVNLPITLEDKEKNETIYNGHFSNELVYTNAYFYTNSV